MKTEWVAIGYSVPAEPSKNRVYIWRKLKECGAEYFKQGVAVLPRTDTNIASFRRLADKIKAMDGEAWLVEMHFLDPCDENDMVERFRLQSRSEYQNLLTKSKEIVEHFRGGDIRSDDAEAAKLAKELEQVQKRDHFGNGLTAELREGLETLLGTALGTAQDFKAQLRSSTQRKDK